VLFATSSAFGIEVPAARAVIEVDAPFRPTRNLDP
jgi:hypothetical protein